MERYDPSLGECRFGLLCMMSGGSLLISAVVFFLLG